MITEEVAKANAEQYSLVIIVYAGMEYYAAIKKNKADLLVPIWIARWAKHSEIY